jgi:hypothetical protein
VRYKFLYYVVFISFLILKIVVSWVESVKIPASKMAAIKQSPVPPPPPLSFCEGPRILQNLRDVVFQILELPLYILSFLAHRAQINFGDLAPYLTYAKYQTVLSDKEL